MPNILERIEELEQAVERLRTQSPPVAGTPVLSGDILSDLNAGEGDGSLADEALLISGQAAIRAERLNARRQNQFEIAEERVASSRENAARAQKAYQANPTQARLDAAERAQARHIAAQQRLTQLTTSTVASSGQRVISALGLAGLPSLLRGFAPQAVGIGALYGAGNIVSGAPGFQAAGREISTSFGAYSGQLREGIDSLLRNAGVEGGWQGMVEQLRGGGRVRDPVFGDDFGGINNEALLEDRAINILR